VRVDPLTYLFFVIEVWFLGVILLLRNRNLRRFLCLCIHIVLANLSLNVIPSNAGLLLNYRSESIVETLFLTRVLAASLLLLRHFRHLLFPLRFLVCLLNSLVSFALSLLIAVGLFIRIVISPLLLPASCTLQPSAWGKFLELTGFGLHAV